MLNQKSYASLAAWTPVHIGLEDRNFSAINISSVDPNLFLIASDTNLYRSLDRGKTWKQIFRLAKSETVIHKIALHPFNVNYVYLLTSDGLYISTDQGINWFPSYIEFKAENRSVLSIAFHPRDRSQILLGTISGLYISRDWGKTWERIFAELSDQEIRDLGFHPHAKNMAYAVTARTVYGLDLRLRQAVKLFETSIVNNETNIETVEGDETSGTTGLKNIAMDDLGYFLFTAGDTGLYQSIDKGFSWKSIGPAGGSLREITGLLVSPFDDSLFIASGNGVFTFFPGDSEFQELYSGLPTQRIQGLAVSIDSEEELFCLTSQGLYKLTPVSSFAPTEVVLAPTGQEVFEKFSAWVSAEPSITEIQHMAVKYSDTGNGKIKHWQSQSRLSALLPEFSIDAGWSADKNIDVDRGSTTEKDTFILGPDNSGFEWGLGFDWDLKRFIWSSDQTSIDSREKLMVELRESLLREVTRLYFERRRLQMELIAAQSAQNQDFVSLGETSNRVSELAAQIDALTGQYLANRWQAPEYYIPQSDSRSQEIRVDQTRSL